MARKKSKFQKTIKNYQKKFKKWYRKPLHQNITHFFGVWFFAYLILLSSFFSYVTVGGFNTLEFFPSETVFPALLHAVSATGIALLFAFLPWLKSFTGKLIAGVVGALSLTGYNGNLGNIEGFIRALTPGITKSEDIAIISIIYLIILAAIALGVGLAYEHLIKKLGKKSKIKPNDITLGIMIFVLIIFAIPTFKFVGVISIVNKESKVEAPALPKPKKRAPVTEKPDIYYIVLDRYTNNQQLREQFGYDNSPFANVLKSQGFKVNDNAYNSYPYTTMSISSTMAANYTNKQVEPFKNETIQSRTLYHNIIRTSPVVKALKDDGYEYHAIGSWYGATSRAPLANVEHIWIDKINLFGKNKIMRGIEGKQFKETPYVSLSKLSHNLWPLRSQSRSHSTTALAQIDTLNSLATTKKQGGRFIFAHILVPHGPYAFNSDGSISTHPSQDSVGKDVKKKYLDQITFINGQIRDLVEKIKKSSGGKAVVLLNPDEGEFPEVVKANDKDAKPTKKTDMRTWPDAWLKIKHGINQAVYIPKATEEDYKHLTSVNMFRVVLNRYLNYNLPYLPICHFTLTNGPKYEYNYADITERLTGKPNKACKQYESLRDK